MPGSKTVQVGGNMVTKIKVPVIEYKKGGKSVSAPAKGDALDSFLRMMDDPNDWRTLSDKESGETFQLTPEELEIIHRIQKDEYADVNYDPYEPYVDFFTGTIMPVPLSSAPEPKRRFVPSKWEALKVSKIVKAIRNGWIKIKEQEEAAVSKGESIYDMWSGEVDPTILAIKSRHISAPRISLPDHRESYNPPAEYLLTAEEREEWENMDPEDRPYNYIPQKFSSLRLVPAYGRLLNERYSRCLDLFLCPRAIRDRVTMHPDDLLPKLPDPRDLRPFPTQKSIEFIGHNQDAPIVCISVDPTGQWLLSSSKDGTVRLWEVQTGRCARVWKWEQTPSALCWNPNKALFIFAVAVDRQVYIVAPPDLPPTDSTKQALQDLKASQPTPDTGVVSCLKWSSFDRDDGTCVAIEHHATITDVHWHRRGDYFAALAPSAQTGAHVLTIHQLSRSMSQHPFQKMPGIMRAVRFHPTRPHIALVTQKSIRLYDLVKHEPVKKMLAGVNSISSVAMHSGGDNIIVGSHDQRLCWFDLDFSMRPYRVLGNHQGAIRSVAFHQSFPLFASSGDDGAVQIVHGQVYDDLSANAMIVPVKTIRDFPAGSSVTQVVFHPLQPWIFCATSTGQISLFV